MCQLSAADCESRGLTSITTPLDKAQPFILEGQREGEVGERRERKRDREVGDRKIKEFNVRDPVSQS